MTANKNTTVELAVDADRAHGGYAALAYRDADSDRFVVNGVALGPGDETRGMSGKRTRWPGEVLEDATELLVGTPITAGDLDKKHPGAERDDGELAVDPEAPDDATIGRVTDSRWDDSLGLLWQGEIDDEDTADLIERGKVDVSPVVSREVQPLGGDHAGDMWEAASVNGFRDLTVLPPEVPGAAPSNHVESGAMAEALAAAFPTDADALADFNHLSHDGTSGGKLDESEIPSDGFASHYLFPGDTKSDSSFPVVDSSGNLRRGNVSSAWSERGHAPGSKEDIERVLVNLAGNFDDPPVTEDDADALTTGDDPTARASTGQKETEDSLDTMTDYDNLSDGERELLADAENVDEPTVISGEDADLLAEADELLAAADEVDGEPTVVEQSEYETLAEYGDLFESHMSDQLVEKRGLREATVEAMSFEAMVSEFEVGEDEDAGEDALVMFPETGDTSEDEAEASGAEALSADERDRIELCVKQASRMQNHQRDFADEKRVEAAEALGLPEDADLETIKEEI